MEIPEFSLSPTFIEKVQMPSLHAVVPESRLPILGQAHEKTQNGVVPGFQIYLRGRTPQKLSAWHRQWLRRLFEEEGIIAAIRSGLEGYEAEADEAQEESEPSSRADGSAIDTLLPRLLLEFVVLDEVTRQIFLGLSASEDANLEEHGLTIYRERNSWKLGYAEVMFDYIRGLDPEETGSGEKESGATDPSFLYGRWDFDEEATLAHWRSKGWTLDGLNRYRGYSEVYSVGLCTVHYPTGDTMMLQILGCELKGKRLVLKTRDQDGFAADLGLKYDGDRLIGDFVVRRVT